MAEFPSFMLETKLGRFKATVFVAGAVISSEDEVTKINGVEYSSARLDLKFAPKHGEDAPSWHYAHIYLRRAGTWAEPSWAARTKFYDTLLAAFVAHLEAHPDVRPAAETADLRSRMERLVAKRRELNTELEKVERELADLESELNGA